MGTMIRRAFITGGSRGIGRAIVERYLQAGYEVEAPTRSLLDLSSVDSVRHLEANQRDAACAAQLPEDRCESGRRNCVTAMIQSSSRPRTVVALVTSRGPSKTKACRLALGITQKCRLTPDAKIIGPARGRPMAHEAAPTSHVNGSATPESGG